VRHESPFLIALQTDISCFFTKNIDSFLCVFVSGRRIHPKDLPPAWPRALSSITSTRTPLRLLFPFQQWGGGGRLEIPQFRLCHLLTSMNGRRAETDRFEDQALVFPVRCDLQ